MFPLSCKSLLDHHATFVHFQRPAEDKYPVGPMLLGLFIFVVCGSGTYIFGLFIQAYFQLFNNSNNRFQISGRMAHKLPLSLHGNLFIVCTVQLASTFDNLSMASNCSMQLSETEYSIPVRPIHNLVSFACCEIFS